ncbi:hypothetical protein RHMOL_Rhmol05G0127000 [Rhododendron molle]|uniref:Uncharacterized protein n=1 Tax=Rhododendron molle TaxID=49168 RepID=A0ACC0NPK3_RHOML|nr:hypothetical protein RHMOL_Rhmol05G0127000 [Rhododendron molle]
MFSRVLSPTTTVGKCTVRHHPSSQAPHTTTAEPNEEYSLLLRTTSSVAKTWVSSIFKIYMGNVLKKRIAWFRMHQSLKFHERENNSRVFLNSSAMYGGLVGGGDSICHMIGKEDVLSFSGVGGVWLLLLGGQTQWTVVPVATLISTSSIIAADTYAFVGGKENEMKKLTHDWSLIVAALSSSLIVFFALFWWKIYQEDQSTENIQRIFVEAGNIKNICIRDPHAAREPKKRTIAEKLLSGKASSSQNVGFFHFQDISEGNVIKKRIACFRVQSLKLHEREVVILSPDALIKYCCVHQTCKHQLATRLAASLGACVDLKIFLGMGMSDDDHALKCEHDPSYVVLSPSSCISAADWNEPKVAPVLLTDHKQRRLLQKDDLGRATPGSRNPSRTASRNAFENGEAFDSSEAELAHVRRLASPNPIQSNVNVQSSSDGKNVGLPIFLCCDFGWFLNLKHHPRSPTRCLGS